MSAPGVGDRGQRYEVRYTDAASGEEKVMGWTDQADGGALLRSALLWPAVKERPDGTRIAWVVDRRPDALSKGGREVLPPGQSVIPPRVGPGDDYVRGVPLDPKGGKA